MNADADIAGRSGAPSTRALLAAEVRRLEDELQRAQERLLALGGEVMPGLHLLVDAGGMRALLPSSGVTQIVRLVATVPLPNAPAHVLGTFVYRGTPVLAVDLAAAIGARHEPPLDAHIIVLAGSRPLGLVVDRVDRLVDGPRLFEGDAAKGMPEAWRGSRLVAGLCVLDGQVVPLLEAGPLGGTAAEGA